VIVPAELLRHVLRREDHGVVLAQPLDLMRLKMVVMGVRQKDHVCRRIRLGRAPRVDVQVEAVVAYRIAGLPEPGEPLEHEPPSSASPRVVLQIVVVAREPIETEAGFRAAVSLLRNNRNFRRLYLASVISLGGDWFLLIACSG
jgi:hypothetical protein